MENENSDHYLPINNRKTKKRKKQNNKERRFASWLYCLVQYLKSFYEKKNIYEKRNNMLEKDNKEMFVKFNKEAYKRDSIELFVYGILKLFENKEGFSLISIKQLMEFTDLGRSRVCKIEEALTTLIDQNVIRVYDSVDFQNKVEISNVKSSDMLYVKIDEIVTEKDPFIQIYTKEILRFISKKIKGTKADVFKQFLYIMKYVNQGNGYKKISFPNIGTIAKETGVSDRTVKNYTKTLEEEGFLYSNILILEKEKIKKIYSRPQYSEDVDEAIAECIANNTKVINIKKDFIQKNNTSEIKKEKEHKSTMTKPELLIEIDSGIKDTFLKYDGEMNDTSLSKLQKYQEKQGVETIVKALHLTMDGKKGLNNPTGFMLKALEKGDVIKEAQYFIKRSKEQSERMDREDIHNRVSVDYHELWRKKKEKVNKETIDISQDIKALLG